MLLLAFSGLMLVAAYGMWRRLRGRPARAPARSARQPHTGVATAAVRLDRRAPWSKVLVAGTVVGLLTGFFGVGGGFVIVPALVLASASRCPKRSAPRCSSSRSTRPSRSHPPPGRRDRVGHRVPVHVAAIGGVLVGSRLAEHPRLRCPAAAAGSSACSSACATYTAVPSAVVRDAMLGPAAPDVASADTPGHPPAACTPGALR